MFSFFLKLSQKNTKVNNIRKITKNSKKIFKKYAFFVNYGNFSPENHGSFRKHNKKKKNKNNKKQGRIIWFYRLICDIINYKLIGRDIL